jgi:hypothetical protein
MGARDTREFDGVRVETVDWPIVLVDFPVGRLADATLHAVLDALETVMREAEHAKEKIFIINDLTHIRSLPPASQRKLTGEWIERTANLSRVVSVGAAQVTPSAILRGIITAVFWFHPSPSPSVFVATREEAMSRGIRMLEEAGVDLPSRLRGQRRAVNS